MQTLAERMIDCGYLPQELPAPGKVKRFPAPEKTTSNGSAWIMGLDHKAAIFGDWITGARFVWSAEDKREMTHQERCQLDAQLKQARKKVELELQVQYEQAAKRAKGIYEKSADVVSHAYLSRKGILAHGIKQYGNSLIIPMIDSNLEISTVQSISPDGFKKFMPKGKTKGCYYPLQIGEKDKRTVIAEGFATASSLLEFYYQEATVVAAFSGANLKNVAKTFKELLPDNQIIIAGDNDTSSKHNVGKRYAIEAASLVGGIIDIPEFYGNEVGTDWNDRAMIDFAHLLDGETA